MECKQKEIIHPIAYSLDWVNKSKKIEMEKNMKRYRSKLVLILVVCMLLNLGSGIGFVQAKEYPIIPEADWTNEEWEDYYSEIRTCIGENESARYMTLDGIAMTDYKLYYIEGSHSISSNDSFDTEGYTEIRQLTDYPGVFVWDTSMMESGSQYFPYGRFQLYNKSETVPTKDICSVSNEDILVSKGEASELKWFTVSFEQGDVDTIELPETEIYLSGQEFNNTDGVDTGICYPCYDGMIAGGYAFSHWEDQAGKKYWWDDTITKTTRLHPVYVNEQNCTYNNSDIRSNNQYYDWTWDNTQDNNEMPKQTITSGVELLKEIAVTAYSDLGKFLIIDRDITINHEVVAAFIDETGASISQMSGLDTLYWSKDFIIITGNGSLTLDGVYIQNNDQFPSDSKAIMTVQSGGSFNVINGAIYEKCVLSVQQNATVEIDEGRILAASLFNHGTIHVSYPEDGTNEKADGGTARAISVEDIFFNASSGKINISYGIMDISNDHKWNYYVSNEDTYSTIGEMKYIRNRNRGEIVVTRDGGLNLDASSSSYQNDRMRLMPFVNEGTITIDAFPSEGYYRNVCQLEYSRFLNKGNLTIEQKSYTPKYEYSWGDHMDSSAAGLRAYKAEITNEGIITINTESGIGLRVDEAFFDPNDTIESTTADRIQYGKLANKKNGTVQVTSSTDSIGLVIGEEAVLDNEGNITLTNTNTNQRTNNITLGSNGTINNNGSILNNGSIGYSYCTAQEMLQYNGNAFTGNGFFSFLYSLDYTDSDLLRESEVKMTVDGVDLGNVASQYSVYGFYPADKTIPVTIKTSGYEDYSGSFKIPATVDDYRIGTDYNNNENYVRTFVLNLVKRIGDVSNVTPPPSSNPDFATTSDKQNATENNNTSTSTIPKVGTRLVETKTKAIYMVTKEGREVTYVKPKNKMATFVSISKTVVIDGITYQVTAIGVNAFSGCSKLKKITIGKNVAAIGNNAFYKCTKLTKIVIPSKVNKIGRNAFYGCKALKSITIKSAKLTSKNVGSKAFKGIHAKATIKVLASKLKDYKKILKARGVGKKVKIKK